MKTLLYPNPLLYENLTTFRESISLEINTHSSIAISSI